MYEVLVGGVLFESDPKDHSRAFVIEPEGLQGWYDSVDVRAESLVRPAQHGEFDLPVFRAARIITVSGTALAASAFELAKLRDVLGGILADGESGKLVVADPEGSISAVVRLSGAPKFSPHPDGLEGDFQISFKAVDPRKYGQPRTIAGTTVEMHHYGNFPASPTIEVPGPVAAPYSITGPGGREVRVTQPLTGSQRHQIDFATGRVYRNGARQSGALAVFQPWTIPPGRQIAMAISSGTMSVTVTDTYM